MARQTRSSSPKFISLSRNRRADMVFKLKHRIANGPFPNFWSHSYLDEGVSWADIYFIGPDKFTFWNATVMSGPDAYQNAKEEAAFEEVYGALTPEERQLDRAKFVPCEVHPGYSEIKFSEMKFDKFEGRTTFEQMRKREKEIEVEVFAHHRIFMGYRYGIGLQSVVDLPILTIELLENYVETFPFPQMNSLQNGIIWQADSPLLNTTTGQVFKSNAVIL